MGIITREINVWVVFMCLMLFTYFSVQKFATDIIMQCHPWKEVQQPFAAIKCEGHRAYLLGFPDVSLFEVENESRQWAMMPFHLFGSGIMFFAKLVIYIQVRWVAVLVSVLISFPSIIWAWVNFWKLKQDRATAYNHIIKRIHASQDSDLKTDVELNILKRMLGLHFGRTLDGVETELQPTRISRSQFKSDFLDEKCDTLAVCQVCGRGGHLDAAPKWSVDIGGDCSPSKTIEENPFSPGASSASDLWLHKVWSESSERASARHPMRS